MTTTVSINPSGKTEISSYSLKNDHWEDHLNFLDQAREATSARVQNRLLRASFLTLFAHVEATANDLFQRSPILTEKKPPNSIRKKLETLSTSAKLDSVPIEHLIDVRNIVVHPGGSDDESRPFRELTLEELARVSGELDNWLEIVCEVHSIDRQDATEESVKKLSDALGHHDRPQEL